MVFLLENKHTPETAYWHFFFLSQTTLPHLPIARARYEAVLSMPLLLAYRLLFSTEYETASLPKMTGLKKACRALSENRAFDLGTLFVAKHINLVKCQTCCAKPSAAEHGMPPLT